MYIQVMTFAQAEACTFNPFDLTKVWSQKDYPLIPVGTFTLNRNPKNYFAEVEQIAFSPAHLVPGIEPSPDKMLQGRLFSYSDTHRHRLGANYLQLPVNCPFQNGPRNYQRDGPQCYTDNQGGAPNYFPNSFGGPAECPRVLLLESKPHFSGDVERIDTSTTEDNYFQATTFWNDVLDEQAKTRCVNNLVDHMKGAAGFIQERAVSNFAKVHPDLGARLQQGLAEFKRYHSNL